MRRRSAPKRMGREIRILNAAEKLFIRYGIARTSVEDIANEAGISKGAIYLHFASKEMLVDTLIVRELEVLIDDLGNALDSDPEGYTIFNVYRHTLQILVSNPFLKALYTQDKRTLGDYSERLRQIPGFRDFGTLGNEFVRHFQAAGMIDQDVDSHVLSTILLALRIGMFHIEEYVDHEPPIEQLGETVGLMLQRAFGRTDGDQEAAKAALKALLDTGRSAMRQGIAQWKSQLGNESKP